MSDTPRERTLVPAQRKNMDYSQPPGLRTDALDKAYAGKVDNLDVFMSKAFPHPIYEHADYQNVIKS